MKLKTNLKTKMNLVQQFSSPTSLNQTSVSTQRLTHQFPVPSTASSIPLSYQVWFLFLTKLSSCFPPSLSSVPVFYQVHGFPVSSIICLLLHHFQYPVPWFTCFDYRMELLFHGFQSRLHCYGSCFPFSSCCFQYKAHLRFKREGM